MLWNLVQQEKTAVNQNDNSLLLSSNTTLVPEFLTPKTATCELRRSWLHSSRTIYHLNQRTIREIISAPVSTVSSLFEAAIAAARILEPDFEDIELDAILECANHGYFPAQAVCVELWLKKRAYIPDNIKSCVERWNFNAVASGFRLSQWSFKVLKPPLYALALELFRRTGGYNSHYSGDHLASRDVARADHNEYVSGLVGSLEHDLVDHPVHLAAALNNPNLQQILVSKNALGKKQLLEEEYCGNTPLMMCCMAGHIESLRVLVNMGASGAQVNRVYGYSAVHWLFMFKDDDIEDAATLLKNAGADFNVRNKKSLVAFHIPFSWPCGTPLHWAVFANNITAVKAVLKQGCSLSATDCYDQTALLIALKMLNAPMIELLLDAGAELTGTSDSPLFSKEDDQSDTTSSSAELFKDPKETLVHKFLSTKLHLGNLNDPDFDLSLYGGELIPPRYESFLFGSGDYTQRLRNVLHIILRHAPGCLRWTTSDWKFPLHCCVSEFTFIPEMLDTILELGPGFHELSGSQESALNILLCRQPYALNDDALSELLDRQLNRLTVQGRRDFLNRADPASSPDVAPSRYTDTACYRPIHYTAELGLVKCLRVLIGHGADPLLRTEDSNQSALDVAVAAVRYVSPKYQSCSSRSSLSSNLDQLYQRSQPTSLSETDCDNNGHSIADFNGEQRFCAHSPLRHSPPLSKYRYHNFSLSIDRWHAGRYECINILSEIDSVASQALADREDTKPRVTDC
jgi:ankyrin repeat protein